LAFFSTLSAIVAVGFVNFLANQAITYLLVFILGLLVFGPILRRIVKRSFDIAEPGIWFALFYFTHFGLRAIYDLTFGSKILGFGPESVDFDLINAALGVSIVGLLMFWTGYHTSLGKAFANSFPRLPFTWSRSRALLIAIVCTIFGWSLRIFTIFYQSGGISAWITANKYEIFTQSQGTVYLSIFSDLAMVGLLIFFILAKMSRRRKYWFLFIFSFILDSIFRFLSGSRGQFIFLLLSLAIGLYMKSRRDYKTSIRYAFWAAVLVLLLIFLFPLFSIIRVGLENPVETFSRASDFWKDPLILFNLIGGRQVGLESLALVIDHTPEEPYTLGSELALVAVAWVPRKVWPGKPIISVGKIFYKKFYPAIYHEGTSVAVTLPGEFYWAFGLAGVVMGMLIIGILWRFLFEYLVRPKHNLSNILVVTFVFSGFFVAIEQTLGSLLTTHLLTFVMIVIITFVIHGRAAKKGVA
jgi:oligosaccharide repeat unit polymerase